MPFLDENEIAGYTIPTLLDRRTRIFQEIEHPDFFTEVLPAAFRLDNTYGSLVSREDMTFQEDPNFKITEQDVFGYEDHIDLLVGADSKLELDALKKQIDRENQDRDILAQAGVSGMLASLAAGTIDPINLIPVAGVVARGVRLSKTAAQIAGRAALVGAASNAIAEGALRATQETRPWHESALAIASGAIIMGAIGGTAGAIGARTLKRAVRELRDEVSRIDLEIPVSRADLEADGVRVPETETEFRDSERIVDTRGRATIRQGKSRIKVPKYLQQAIDNYSARLARALGDPNQTSQIMRAQMELREAFFRANTKKDDGVWLDFVKSIHEQTEDFVMRMSQPAPEVGVTAFPENLVDLARKMRRSEAKVETSGAGTETDPVRILNKQQQAAATRATNKFVAALKQHIPGDEFDKVQARADLHREIVEAIDKETAREAAPPVEVTSVGAASRNGFTAKLKSAFGADKLAAALKLSPMIRALTSPSAQVRRTIMQLVETPFRMTDNALGLASPHSVETILKQWEYPRARLKKMLHDSYKSYRKRMRQTAQSEKMNAIEFKEAVGKAMRRDDLSDVPEVQTMAQAYRRELFEPAKEAMIETKLLPEDVTPEFAPSYLTRVYNVPKVRADVQGWRNLLRPWIKANILSEARALEKSARKARTPIKAEEFMQEALILRGFGDADYDTIADEIADQIGSVPAGRAKYEAVALKSPKLRGRSIKRALSIPDAKLEPFLVSDIDLVADTFFRTAISDIELARVFDGDPSLKTVLGDEGKVGGIIREEYKALKAAAERPDLAEDLARREKQDLQDIGAMLLRLRHMRQAPESHNTGVMRASRLVRQFNLVTKLGQVVVSSIPDLARPVMVHGALRAIGNPLKRMMLRMSGNSAITKAATEEVRRAGVALDMVLNTRADRLFDIGDDYARSTVSKIEQMADRMSGSFGAMSLLNPWNRAMKDWAGLISFDRIYGNARKLARGTTLSKSEIERMASLGLDQTALERIGRQFDRHGEEADGLMLGNTDRWDDMEMVRAIRSAVAKDVDTIIVTPSVADRPLLADSSLGGMILQFRSFAFSAVNRVLIAGLQQRDMAALNGAIMTIALGALSFNLKELLAGKDLTTDPRRLVAEGIDRGGLLGILSDGTLLIERASRGTIGLTPLLTGSEPLSRGVSRRIDQMVLGPSLGTLEDFINLTGSISVALAKDDTRELRGKEFRRLLPYSNLFYLRGLMTALAESTNEGDGLHKFAEAFQ